MKRIDTFCLLNGSNELNALSTFNANPTHLVKDLT